jgi:hypothetical protein
MVTLSRIEKLYGQAWPFRLKNSRDEIEEGRQLKVYYLVGVTMPQIDDAAGRRLLESKVVQATQNYETIIRSHESYDEKHVWAQVKTKSRKEMLEMTLEAS